MMTVPSTFSSLPSISPVPSGEEGSGWQEPRPCSLAQPVEPRSQPVERLVRHLLHDSDRVIAWGDLLRGHGHDQVLLQLDDPTHVRKVWPTGRALNGPNPSSSAVRSNTP